MSVLLGVLSLAGALGLEALLGYLAPAALGYVDLMLVAVAYYAIRRSQRSAMLAGCVGGLAQDAWFQVGVFGMSGFRKTLLGWLVGGLATRLDLNHTPGRFVVGAVLSVGDQLLEVGLYRLLDLHTAGLDPVRVAAQAAITGFLVVATFALVDRAGARRSLRRMGGRP